MHSLAYVVTWVFASMLVGVGVGFYIGNSGRSKRERKILNRQRKGTLNALSELVATTEQLTTDVDIHTSEIKEVGRHIVGMELEGPFLEVQQNLLSQVASVLEANQQLEDDLNYARLRMEVQAQELDRTRREARTDQLSGVGNRKGFDEKLQLFVSRFRRESESFALVLCDIDHFKWINDTHGHPAGDQMVANVGKFLKRRLRDNDYVARYGGDEFALLLSKVDANTASMVAERLRADVCSSNFDIGVTIEAGTISFSIGVASIQTGMNAQQLLAAADAALYRSKESGRNLVHCYRHDDDPERITHTSDRGPDRPRPPVEIPMDAEVVETTE